MSGFKPYPAYKDSGVEWLGDVPVGWVKGSLKHMAWIRNGKDHKEAESPDGAYPVIGSGGQFSKASRYLYDGESVLLGRKGTIDKPLYITGRFWTVDTMFYTEVSKAASARFLYYYALTIPFGFYSTSTALPSMTQGDLLNHPAAIPSLFEQTQIARFLDHETARIDALIEEQQRLIELLKEKRQAVISHAVTKGLDPTVPMKDSGVEWLGEVPVHWSFKQSKYLLEFVTSGSRGWAEYYSDDGELFFRIANLTRDSIDPKLLSMQYVTPPKNAEGERSKVRFDDILISITADLGSVCVANNEVAGSYVSQHVALARPIKKTVFSRWFAYFVLSDTCKEQLVGAGYGGTKVQLSLDDIRSFWVSMPPYEEQVLLAAFLDREIQAFDGLITQAAIGMDLLSERRAALISAAVTGKIDVRGWQPPASTQAPESAVAEVV